MRKENVGFAVRVKVNAPTTSKEAIMEQIRKSPFPVVEREIRKNSDRTYTVTMVVISEGKVPYEATDRLETSRNVTRAFCDNGMIATGLFLRAVEPLPHESWQEAYDRLRAPLMASAF